MYVEFFELIFFLLIFKAESAILRRGNPLPWYNAKQYLNSVRTSGIKQFVSHYLRVKDVQTPKFFWGDELEYGIFNKDESSKVYDIAINRGPELLDKLNELENNLSDLPYGCLWQPEYGSWMIETVPRDPYSGYISSLFLVEKSMQLRRKRLHSYLLKNEIAPSISSFPLLGIKGLKHSNITIINNISQSNYLSDNVINPHPRFGALTQNIRMRKGRKVDINIPKESNNKSFINMDAMAFGMGNCCLQVTMQFCNESESRFIHDQLAIFAPIFLALSAATPILKGEMADTDTRWDCISQSVDDRTSIELGESIGNIVPDNQLVGQGIRRIYKSRYSSISRFLYKPQSLQDVKALNELNDIDAGIDDESYELLKKLNPKIDDSLASYIAHLFIRDPLVIFDDSIYLDDNKSLDHFENIQSTNWRTIRWKPPVLDVGFEVERRKHIQAQQKLPFQFSSDDKLDDQTTLPDINSYGPGWRVEFRPLEIQLTDYENAAYSIAIVLLSKTILAMGYNFYLPMSYIEENFRRCQMKDSISNQKFYMNVKAYNSYHSSNIYCPTVDDVKELSMDEIINGSNQLNYLGVIPAIKNYLLLIGCNKFAFDRIGKYLVLLEKRGRGNLPTTAKWIRNYIKNHKRYDKNSEIVNFETVNDLLYLCNEIGMGRVNASELVGDAYIEKLCIDDINETYLKSSINNTADRYIDNANYHQDDDECCNDSVNHILNDLTNQNIISNQTYLHSYPI